MILLAILVQAVILVLHAGEPAESPQECPTADNRCNARRFERKAALANTAELRALYLFAASRSHTFLFEQAGHLADLCSARRLVEQALAVRDVPAATRRQYEEEQQRLAALTSRHGEPCLSKASPPASAPPKVARRGHDRTAPPPSTAPTVSPAPPPARSDPEDDLLEIAARTDAAPRPSPATSSRSPGSLQRPPPPTDAATTPAAVPRPYMRPDRPLRIAGGVTLGAGLSLVGAAIYSGLRLRSVTERGFELQHRPPDPNTLADADTLAREFRTLAPITLTTAIAGGVSVIVGAVLTDRGRRRRAASRGAVVPVLGGVSFHTRF